MRGPAVLPGRTPWALTFTLHVAALASVFFIINPAFLEVSLILLSQLSAIIELSLLAQNLVQIENQL
jgi:hypothetical protein